MAKTLNTIILVANTHWSHFVLLKPCHLTRFLLYQYLRNISENISCSLMDFPTLSEMVIDGSNTATLEMFLMMK